MTLQTFEVEEIGQERMLGQFFPFLKSGVIIIIVCELHCILHMVSIIWSVATNIL